MVRVVNCHAGVLGSNTGRPKIFSPKYFTCGSGDTVAPESASGNSCGLSIVVVDAWLSGNKRGKSVVTVPFLTASLLGKLFSDMFRVVDCHAGVLGSNPGRPKIFSPWNY